MNVPPERPSDILTFALAGLAAAASRCGGIDSSVKQRLNEARERVALWKRPLLEALQLALANPAEEDARLLAMGREFALTTVEVLSVRLAMCAEEDLQVGHAIARAQAPLAARRPTVGLLTHAFGEEMALRAVQVIGHGAAVRAGILHVSAEDVPLPEREISVPLPLCFALSGSFGPWPGANNWPQLDPTDLRRVELGETARLQATEFAARLRADEHGATLIVRSGEPAEARAAVERICAEENWRPVAIQTEQTQRMAAWLFLNGAVPVYSMSLGPGERKPLPAIPLYRGPSIVMSGADGEFEADDRTTWTWNLDVPSLSERQQLWQRHVAPDLASLLAQEHRHSATRITALGREARRRATLRGSDEVGYEDVRAAARSGDSGSVGALAELVSDEVDDDALVASQQLRDELETLVNRCRLRDRLVASLGPALRARYRPCVRALFVGPSGTGKTLAASWLASKLGLPLYRVDLSAITSKYIGETEKNLSQLMARAEQNEVVLLFDEADSLFGKRTDVKDAHDRFANAQTNYLLQRMENYHGITLLTSNSRGRFDAAFTRRLDCIIDFPAPGPEERRALWLAHLGELHALNSTDLNLLAAVAEISGGQIRTAVLGSAIEASRRSSPIQFRDVVAGLQTEYRKMGRQLPDEIQQIMANATV